jgi:hypothetical protein
MQRHGRAVAERQDKACAFALFGADGAEEIGEDMRWSAACPREPVL